MLRVEKGLWFIFYILILIIIVEVLGNLLGIKLEEIYLYQSLFVPFLIIPVILLFLHSFLTLSVSRAILFILLASTTGITMEHIGLKYGTVFGGYYAYKPQLSLFNIPASVIVYWAVFIYTGYCLINSFLYWSNKNKPNIRQKNLWRLPILIVFDGLVVTAIDLFMDPLQVKAEAWKWLEGGPYFGIPIGNFIGWFLVTIIATGLFRIFEYFLPKKENMYDKTIFIIPVLGYGVMALSFCLTAIKYQMFDLALLGSLFTFPTVILNLFLFIKYKRKSIITLLQSVIA